MESCIESIFIVFSIFHAAENKKLKLSLSGLTKELQEALSVQSELKHQLEEELKEKDNHVMEAEEKLIIANTETAAARAEKMEADVKLEVANEKLMSAVEELAFKEQMLELNIKMACCEVMNGEKLTSVEISQVHTSQK